VGQKRCEERETLNRTVLRSFLLSEIWLFTGEKDSKEVQKDSRERKMGGMRGTRKGRKEGRPDEARRVVKRRPKPGVLGWKRGGRRWGKKQDPLGLAEKK